MPQLMDLNALIRSTLEEKGCTISEEVGIWTVKTPEGAIWDFTTPLRNIKKEEADVSPAREE